MNTCTVYTVHIFFTSLMAFSLLRLIFKFVVHGQVMATICEELPPDSVMLVYLSASGL